jgi:hypothetical protein
MKLDQQGYKFNSQTQPTNPAQTEKPGGGPSEDEPGPMTSEAKEMARALGKDDKTAQKLWEARQKANKEKK